MIILCIAEIASSYLLAKTSGYEVELSYIVMLLITFCVYDVKILFLVFVIIMFAEDVFCCEVEKPYNDNE